MLTAEDLAEVPRGTHAPFLSHLVRTKLCQVRIRYIEEIEQPLREHIGELKQQLSQEQV